MVIIRILLTFLLIIAIPCTSFSEGSQKKLASTGSKKKKSKSRKKLSWRKYHQICGAKTDSREENFEKIKGRKIVWGGKITEITKDVALGNNRRWAENVIRVKMDPSDSLVADIRLRIPKEMVDKMMTFEKGQYVGFKGKIMYIGTRLSDHVVEVENFKRIKPKKKKPPKETSKDI